MELHTSLSLGVAEAQRVLADWLGTSVRCSSIEPLKGGMLNTVLSLTFDREPFGAVMKINVPERGFGREARMLRHLRQQTRFPCPIVYAEEASARTIPYAYLLLETLPGVNMWELPLSPNDRRCIDEELAGVLCELHGHVRDGFGEVDSLGAPRWADVLLPRLHEVRGQPEVSGRLKPEVLRLVDEAIGHAEQALGDQGPPTLVHGDIWAANIIVRPTPTGWRLSGLVDPAAQYADVEMELAYLQEFSCVVGPAFFSAYTARRPLRPGFEYRRLFYWLYAYLVHVWLFEDLHYREKTHHVAEEIRRQCDRAALAASGAAL